MRDLLLLMQRARISPEWRRAGAYQAKADKLCRTCLTRQPISQFYVSKTSRYGETLYRPDCRACTALKHKEKKAAQ